MPTDIVIVGALGRMGREIGAVALADPHLRVAGCLEAPSHPGVGNDYGELMGYGIAGVRVTADPYSLPLDTSVVINFAAADGVQAFLDAAGSLPVRLVLGTTGLSQETMRRIEKLATVAPVVASPNMSLGVNLLFYLTGVVAAKLGEDVDIEIIETHHRHKRDAPSGTAQRLGEIACAARSLRYDRDVKHGRVGMVGERSSREIGMHAVRGGDIVGDHTVLFAAMGERIELRHSAHSRATFARGAIAAAKWIANRAAGLYTMSDVLGLGIDAGPQR